MARRVAAALATLALVAAGSALAAEDAAAAKAPREFFGVVPVLTPEGAEYAQMASMGVGTMRILVSWPAHEPGPGDYKWEGLDRAVASAAAHGIRVFPTIYGTPGWVNLFDGRANCGPGCAPRSSAGLAAFANFMRALVQRYGPGGDFWSPSGGGCVLPPLCPYEGAACNCEKPLPIRSWQLWNEQNSPKYFGPTPNPVDYAKLVGAAAGAIRSVDPKAEIVLGGMWGPMDTDAVIPTPRFLKRFYSVPGIEATFDAIAIHPYAPNMSGVKDQLKRARDTVRKAGDRKVGLWITELGWASAGPKSQGLVKTPNGQARMLDKSFRFILKKRRAWRIRGVTWFSWRDASNKHSDCAWCARAGLQTKTGAPKPSGRAFKKLALRYGR